MCEMPLTATRNIGNSEPRAPMISVFIADSTPMDCELMATALTQSRYCFTVAGCSTESDASSPNILKAKIDVAVISAQLKDGPSAGFTFARELRASHPSLRVVMLLDSSERTTVVKAFRSGACGILSREEPFDILCKCIETVYRGQIWASSKEMRFALNALVQVDQIDAPGAADSKVRNVLTSREESVVQLVSEGFTNQDISQHLNLSVNTVRNYLFRIFNKVGASNRLELAIYAIKRESNRTQDSQEFSSLVNFDSAA
jgi:two-component system nitrate/nitrite response regulator NarL